MIIWGANHWNPKNMHTPIYNLGMLLLNTINTCNLGVIYILYNFPIDPVWYISNKLYVKYGTNENCMEVSLYDLILISLSGKITPPILNQSHALNSLGVWFYFSKVVSTHSYVSNSLLSLFYFVWIYPAPRSATGSLVPSELPCSPLP